MSTQLTERRVYRSRNLSSRVQPFIVTHSGSGSGSGGEGGGGSGVALPKDNAQYGLLPGTVYRAAADGRACPPETRYGRQVTAIPCISLITSISGEGRLVRVGGWEVRRSNGVGKVRREAARGKAEEGQKTVDLGRR